MSPSHYISQLLLRGWQYPRGWVRYFDFSSGVFDDCPIKDMYTSPIAFSKEVEDWLNTHIETPLGGWLTKCGRRPKAPEPNEREVRAIKLALIVQQSRTDAANTLDTSQLDRLARGDERLVDFVIGQYEADFETALGLCTDGVLCFPDSGSVLLPMLPRGGWFLPLTQRVYAAACPRDAFDGSFDLVTRKWPGFLTALSVGLEGARVVVPRMRDDADEAKLAEELRTYRAKCRRIWAILSDEAGGER